MGVELDLSDLAVLRPVQTAAAGDGPDAADTGCVTPTAASSLLPRLGLGGGLLDIDSAACVTPTASPCLLRPATVCPPAPRKPARPAPDNKRKRCCCARAFFPVPHDLSAVFVPRRSPPRAAKKVRLHLVG